MPIVLTTDPYGGSNAIAGDGSSGAIACPPLPCGGKQFTIGLWFTKASTESNTRHTLFRIPTQVGGSLSYLTLYLESGNLICHTNQGGSSIPVTILADVWHHYAVVVEESGDLTVYLDGVKILGPVTTWGIKEILSGTVAILGDSSGISNPLDARFDYFLSLTALNATTVAWYIADKTSTAGANSLPPG